MFEDVGWDVSRVGHQSGGRVGRRSVFGGVRGVNLRFLRSVVWCKVD